MRTETLIRRVLNGPTMGTRYSAVVYVDQNADLDRLGSDLQRAVDAVDDQMSTWKANSNLMQLNRWPVDEWYEVPEQLAAVLDMALMLGRRSEGAFDIGVGDLVGAWGFGPPQGTVIATGSRVPTHRTLELDTGRRRVRKHAPVALDLSGIAKGFGVDEIARVLETWGITSYLASIDGEVRAGDPKPGGTAWRVALEKPVPDRREPEGIIDLVRASLATSGDYRHFVERDGVRHSHTIDPGTGEPLVNGPAAVTVRARTCVEADGWATATMVLGRERGEQLARELGFEVLFAERDAAPSARTTPADSTSAARRRQVIARPSATHLLRMARALPSPRYRPPHLR